jgi:hypothetical protein
MLGLFATQLLFQGIVGVALFMKSKRVAQQSSFESRAPAAAE